MTAPKIDIARLRELAREATPGPWREWKDQVLIGEEWVRDLPAYDDARYIAALSPDVTLALLAEAEDARSLAQERAAALGEVMALRDRIASLEAERSTLLARVAELEAARHLCEECASDDAEHGLDLVGDWHCGSCGVALS